MAARRNSVKELRQIFRLREHSRLGLFSDLIQISCNLSSGAALAEQLENFQLAVAKTFDRRSGNRFA